jgi:hypothetical protein
MYIRTCSIVAGVLLACSPSSPPPPRPASINAVPASERTAIPQTTCESQGGTVVGDIGDGATHRPDYVCPSGKRPVGAIAPPEGGPIAVEGAVCCPR